MMFALRQALAGWWCLVAEPDGAVLASTVQVADGRTTVRLHGELEQETAQRLRRDLLPVLRRGPGELVIDMTGVSFLDATGSKVLVWAYKQMLEQGGSLLVVGATPQARQRLGQLGLQRVLGSREDGR
jgi:anti-anti-sigma factor